MFFRSGLSVLLVEMELGVFPAFKGLVKSFVAVVAVGSLFAGTANVAAAAETTSNAAQYARARAIAVQWHTGKSVLVRMRYACNHRLRNALYHWGRVSAQHDPSTRRHYRALRQRGHGHARAIRGVIDRLLVVLMAMLRTGTTYDPARRRVPAAA